MKPIFIYIILVTALFVGNINPLPAQSVLWRITTDWENPKEVYRSKLPISSLSFHPDGQKIVVTTLNQGAEIWKVDNLLSNEEVVK